MRNFKAYGVAMLGAGLVLGSLLGLPFAGADKTPSAVPVTLKILKRPLRSTDGVPLAVSPRANAKAARLALETSNVRLYVAPGKGDHLCLLDARFSAGRVDTVNTACSDLDALRRDGAIVQMHTSEGGQPWDISGIVPDGYTAVAAGSYVGRVVNNTFVIDGVPDPRVLVITGPHRATTRFHLHVPR